jgi:protein required for attachment to host cells
MKKETWIVVANSSHAKIYKAENNKQLVEIKQFKHPESRLHDSDLVSSKPGRTNARTGYRRSTYEPTTDPKDQEINSFAKEISLYLDYARENENLGRIYLTASPAFLGVLRRTLSSLTDHLIAGEVDADMTHLKSDEIRSHLPLVL